MNIIDLNESSYFISKDIFYSWIMLDFKDKEVKILHYTLKTFGDASNSHLKSWVLEISQNYYDWNIIDQRINDMQLKKECGSGSYQVFSKRKGRYVRLRQTDLNHRNCMLLSSIELFGKLYW